jgi:hypothetical protein
LGAAAFFARAYMKLPTRPFPRTKIDGTKHMRIRCASKTAVKCVVIGTNDSVSTWIVSAHSQGDHKEHGKKSHGLSGGRKLVY